MSNFCERRLDNGLTLLVETLDRPAAASHLLIPGGTALDPAGGEGAGAMLALLLLRGAGERNARDLAEAFDALGYRKGVGANQGAMLGTLTGLASEWPAAMSLLADVLRRPWLPGDELEPCRQLALQTVIGLDDDPGHKLLIELLRRYFPGPFGRCRLGTVAGLQSLSADDVKAHWTRLCAPSGAVLAVSGGVPADHVVAQVEALFGDWSGAAAPAPAPDNTGRPAYEHVAQTAEQVHLGLAWPDVRPDDPARYHALMVGMVLSGGMGARLFTEVREKRGLCYSVHARTNAWPGHGFMIASAGTTTERSSETLEVMAEVLRGLPGTVTADEVERGRVRLLSSLIMGDESTSGRAARLANDWYLLGRVRPFEEVRAGIEAVTADSLNAHLEAHPPRDFTVVTLGTQFTWPAGLTL